MKMINSFSAHILALCMAAALVLMGTPTVLAETITFSDLGIATELTSGQEASTPVGTFYLSSKNPMEISVDAYWKLRYRLTIYINDAPLKSGEFRDSGTLLVTIPSENLNAGKNTIYVKGTSLYSVYDFGGAEGNLIIYGTSKISSPSIILPSASPTTTKTPLSDSIETSSEPTSSAVLLHGEKTDVVLGEDILLKLSAVNLITNPPMTVQVILYPPSGMSVSSSEFVKSGAGIYTTTYSLNRGEGRDIEVRIKTNQVGDFNVKGRIVYYFGDNQSTAEDHTLNLPIKVRKEVVLAQNEIAPTPTPGFGIIIGLIAVLFISLKKRGIKE